MTNLFVYGALMYDEVWSRIVNAEFRRSKGKISGYRRLIVKNEEYPGLVEGEGIVSGCIWYGVDNKNLESLDSFEGEYYERITDKAIDESGNMVDVHIYSFKKEFHNLLENADWNVEEFEKNGLEKFIKCYVGFDKTT